MLLGRRIALGPGFYNSVLIPTGLLLLAATAAAPLLRWGKPPLPGQRIALLVAAVAGTIVAATAMACGVRSLTALAVVGLATSAAIALVGTLVADARRGSMSALSSNRRQYAGFVIHLGFVCLAVGDCLLLQCANCCKTTGPLFTDNDISRISRHLRMKPAAFMQAYLRVDEDGDHVLKELPCPFLGADNYCGIYEVRPRACREYPHTDRKRFYQIHAITMKNMAICPAAFRIVEDMKKRLPEYL